MDMYDTDRPLARIGQGDSERTITAEQVNAVKLSPFWNNLIWFGCGSVFMGLVMLACTAGKHWK